MKNHCVSRNGSILHHKIKDRAKSAARVQGRNRKEARISAWEMGCFTDRSSESDDSADAVLYDHSDVDGVLSDYSDDDDVLSVHGYDDDGFLFDHSDNDAVSSGTIALRAATLAATDDDGVDPHLRLLTSMVTDIDPSTQATTETDDVCASTDAASLVADLDVDPLLIRTSSTKTDLEASTHGVTETDGAASARAATETDDFRASTRTTNVDASG